MSLSVREGEAAWFKVVRRTLHTLINAEEMGISSADEKRAGASARKWGHAATAGRRGRTAAQLGEHHSLGRDALAVEVGDQILGRLAGRHPMGSVAETIGNILRTC